MNDFATEHVLLGNVLDARSPSHIIAPSVFSPRILKLLAIRWQIVGGLFDWIGLPPGRLRLGMRQGFVRERPRLFPARTAKPRLGE
jgi:hypothetical protein